jgi:3-isopropylmalate/(R)-2-methylmalate dehydratase small subunit
MFANFWRGTDMEPFKHLRSAGVPLALANVDTDQIIPARFLWRKRGDGWGDLLLYDLRFHDDGSPRAAFPLNQAQYRDAHILVAGRNFGCGSSREHAVWALYDYGIRAVIASSFGDIFANNCNQNGLLPIVLAPEVVEGLIAALEDAPGTQFEVDLESQAVLAHRKTYPFEIDPFQKECLLAGTDQIGFTLGFKEQIDAFEEAYDRRVT